MMKYFYKLLILSVFIISLACNSSKEDKIGFQTLKIIETDIVAFDHIVDEIEFIPFLIPIENPLKLNSFDPHLVIDDFIYFSTGDYRDASIHVFEKYGEYIKTFKKQGSGPEEYPYLNGFDMIDNQLAVWDDRGNFKLYDKSNFDFRGIKKMAGANLDYMPSYQYLGDDKWILVSDFNGELDENKSYPVFYLLDEKTETLKEFTPKAKALTSNIIEGQIAGLSDKSYILNFGVSDTLFLFQNDSLQPWLAFNFADKNLPEKEKEDPDNFFEQVITQQSYNFNIGTALSANDIVRIGIFGIKKTAEIIEGDMKTLPIQHLYIEYPSMKFTITKAFGAFGGKGYSKDGYYYEILYAEDIQHYLENNYFGKHTEKLEAALDKLVDEEDPILLKYNVKL